MSIMKNICGYRVNGLCSYYPCSDGYVCGKCSALNDPNGCNHTKNIRESLIRMGEEYLSVPKFRDVLELLKIYIGDYIREIRLYKKGGGYVSYEWLFNALDMDPQSRWNPTEETLDLFRLRGKQCLEMKDAARISYETVGVFHGNQYIVNINDVIHGIEMYLGGN